MDYEILKNLACCDLDRKICDAIKEAGTQRKAAKIVGISQSTLWDRLKKLKEYAACRGYAPDNGLVNAPIPSQILNGVSTYYDKDGNPAGRWVKTKTDTAEFLKAAQAMVEEMSASIPREKPVDKVFATDDDLLNLFVLTDAHLGMYAHHEEGGANWDIKIAEQTIMDSFSYLYENTPDAGTAILCNLGDLMHSDSMFPVTPTSHHVLDQDSRQHRVIKTAIRVIRGAVRLLLEKHDKLVLINAQGNHDMVSSLWMQAAFQALYEEEPRVEVVVSPLPYYAYVHGKCLLAFTHGHKRKGPSLADLISGQFRELLAGTEHTFIHTGHFHSQELIETPTSTIEQHPTVAARDSHASHGGWLSKRGMNAIVYHRERLEVARSTFRPG
jgi:DNA-binding Lrp family transcriptional regulator